MQPPRPHHGPPAKQALQRDEALSLPSGYTARFLDEVLSGTGLVRWQVLDEGEAVVLQGDSQGEMAAALAAVAAMNGLAEADPDDASVLLRNAGR